MPNVKQNNIYSGRIKRPLKITYIVFASKLKGINKMTLFILYFDVFFFLTMTKSTPAHATRAAPPTVNIIVPIPPV